MRATTTSALVWLPPWAGGTGQISDTCRSAGCCIAPCAAAQGTALATEVS
jgi:hypothetical protein